MKMLTAILLSLLFTSTASATCVKPEILGMAASNGGGEIMFLTTNENCPASKPGRDALIKTSRGKTIKGCWVFKGDNFLVEWATGHTYMYGFNQVTVAETIVEYNQCNDRARVAGETK